MRRIAIRRPGCVVILLLAAFALNPAARAQSLEYAIKGTYLYKFLPFIDWPAAAFASPASPVTICLAGRDPFGPSLDRAVANENEVGRPVVIRRLGAPADIAMCQVLFIGGGGSQEALDTLRAAEDRPILTVTDSDAPPGARGIISFVLDANHVRFDVDNGAAARSNIVISSKLLALARTVRPKEGGP